MRGKVDGFPPRSVSAASQTRLSGPSGSEHPRLGIDAVTRANRRRHLERRPFHALRRGRRRGPPGGPAAPGGRDRHRHDRRRLRRRRGRFAARTRARGRGARGLLPGGGDRARFLYGGARRGEGVPALHRPAAARAGRLRGLRPHGHRAQPRALWRRSVRPPSPTQPGPHRLHQRDGVGRARGRPRRRAGRRARRRARTRQRLHARPDRLLRALRRADRLGDGDPQPARAVARRAGAGRRPPPRCEPDHTGRRLRRPVPRRRPPRPPVPALGPPLVPPGRLGRARARADRAHAADRRAPRADHAPARLRLEPRARAGGLRRAHADPGARRRRAADRGQARRAGRAARARS